MKKSVVVPGSGLAFKIPRWLADNRPNLMANIRPFWMADNYQKPDEVPEYILTLLRED